MQVADFRPSSPRRIFCHSQNLYWTFEQLDVEAIETPKVPSGMTGGVEFEAMAYAVRLCPSKFT